MNFIPTRIRDFRPIPAILFPAIPPRRTPDRGSSPTLEQARATAIARAAVLEVLG